MFVVHGAESNVAAGSGLKGARWLQEQHEVLHTHHHQQIMSEMFQESNEEQRYVQWIVYFLVDLFICSIHVMKISPPEI